MSGKKLLVADDSLTIQKVIRLALSHEGYDIQAVSDGVEAMEQLLLFRPDLVLIDVSLPGKSATEVKALSDEKPELKRTRFILMSSAFEQIDEAATLKAGFHGRLTKPFDPAHLRKVLVDCLGQIPAEGAVVPPSVPTDFPPIWEGQPATEALAPPPFPAESAVPPPPAEQSSGSPREETDIRKLTQSTLKMAGFDDFEWSVNEGAKKEPVITSAPEAPSELPKFEFEPSLPPLPNMNLGTLDAPGSQGFSQKMEPDLEFNKSMTAIELPQDSLSDSSMILDEAKIESMVREKVEATLVRLSKEMLPQIAERLIKQEIHRLLDEGP